MFDPEKVERARMWEGDVDRGEIVMASDYDQLLAAYRALLLTVGPESSLGYIAAKNGQLVSPGSYLDALTEAERPR